MNKSSITIEKVSLKIIYIRFKGSYADFRKNSRKLFNKSFKFTEKNNLIIQNVNKVLTIYDDNPFITKDNNFRTSVAITVSEDAVIEEADDICVSSINGKFGVGHFEISAKEYGEAWKYMYQEWLLKGEQTPRDAVPFELYVTEPPKNNKDKSFTDIYIPIV